MGQPGGEAEKAGNGNRALNVTRFDYVFFPISLSHLSMLLVPKESPKRSQNIGGVNIKHKGAERNAREALNYDSTTVAPKHLCVVYDSD